MTSPPMVVRNVRRLEWYFRVSAYIAMSAGLLGLLFQVVVTKEAQGLSPVALTLVLFHIAATVWVLHHTFTAMKRGNGLVQVLRSRILIGIVISALAGAAATVVTLLASRNDGLMVLGTTLIGLTSAVCPVLTWRQTLVADAGVILVSAAVVIPVAQPEIDFAAGFLVGLTLSVIVAVGSIWLTGWMLRVLTELDTLRQTAPELAVAEERLRFSRDLHDTFGRTLSVVAVKSELAAELVRRGRSEQAAKEIGDVRQIAEEAGREVRAVASGYRRPDLARELDGARSVLESAGIRCIVDAATQPGPVAAITLGWVVREGVTNVLRHSDATHCRLDLAGTADQVTLTITNDGAQAANSTSATSGNGLIGLTERVHAAGGTVTRESKDGTFVLSVSLPHGGPHAGQSPAAHPMEVST